MLRCQKRFQDFLEEWKAEGTDELKYLPEARELVKPERNTLQVGPIPLFRIRIYFIQIWIQISFFKAIKGHVRTF
jgi:hypothetical protein